MAVPVSSGFDLPSPILAIWEDMKFRTDCVG